MSHQRTVFINFVDTAFIMSETRYKSLAKANPAVAETLFAKAEQDAKQRLETYKVKAGK